jgi:hypothetical protein
MFFIFNQIIKTLTLLLRFRNPTLLIVGSIAICVLFAIMYSRKKSESTNSFQFPSSFQIFGSKELERASPESQSHRQKLKRIAHADSLETMIQKTFVENPMTADGFNKLANSHYKLTEKQITEANSSLNNARTAGLGIIVSNLKQKIEPEGKMVYSFDPALLKTTEDIRRKMHIELSAIVDEKFGETAIDSIARDPRFVGFGTVKLRFVISKSPDESGGEIVRMTALGEGGAELFSTDGSLDGFKNAYRIDFK